jgi:hypothetical protein
VKTSGTFSKHIYETCMMCLIGEHGECVEGDKGVMKMDGNVLRGYVVHCDCHHGWHVHPSNQPTN